MKITLENVLNYPAGTKVKVTTGGQIWTKGVVTGYENDKWGTRLTAITEKGETVKIESFTKHGIGWYVVEIAKSNPNPKSPWAI